MSLILKQEPANTIATPPAGKSTLFITDNSVMAIKTPAGTITEFPTVQGANTQVFFNDDGAINGSANLAFVKTTNTLTLTNGNVVATGVKTDNLYYANGNPWDLDQPAGSNTQLQFNNNGSFGASANLTFNGTTLLVGAASLQTDFPNATVIISQANTGQTHSENIGVVGEAVADSGNTSTWGIGVLGEARANGATKATGVQGGGYVTNSADTGAAVGVRGYSIQTHSGGYNIGVLGNAAGSGLGNYAFYVQAGNIGSIETATTWDLTDNSIAALTFQSTGKANIFGIETTDGAEGIYTQGYLNVTGNITATAGIKTDNYYYANGSPVDFQQAGGSNTQIQFNDANGFGGSAAFTFNNTTNVVTISNGLSVTANANVGNLNSGGNIVANGNLTASSAATVTFGDSTTLYSGYTTMNPVGVFHNTTSGEGTLQVASGNLANGIAIWTNNAANSFIQSTGGIEFITGSTLRANLNPTGGTTQMTLTASGLTVANTLQANIVNSSTTMNAIGNINAGNFVTLGQISAGGNANVGNLGTGGLIGAIGNITGGNLGTIGLIVAVGNITGGNLSTAGTANVGTLNVTGNVTSALLPNANITYDLGSDTQRWRDIYLSNSSIYLGNARLTGNGNAVVSTGNLTGSNITTGGLIVATGNITGGNLITGGTISATGNANVGNIGAAAGVFTTVTGNLTTAAQPNITSVGSLTSLTVTGNANVGNLGTGGLITATGNVTGGNLVTGGLVNATGNITSNANVVTDLIVGRTSSVSITAAGANQNINLTPTGTGTVNVGNFIISNVATPLASTDAATKQYVDDVAQGLHTHDSCNAATQTTLASISGGTVTYNNGTAGVGATLTTTGSYTTIDGVTLSNGMRILVKDEVTTANNGIYVRTSATVLTRADDFDTPTEMAGGDFTFVTAGTLYDNTGWVMPDPVTTVGTSPVVWVQFSGAGTYTAGTGLTLTGSQFSITNTTVAAGAYGNGDYNATFTVNGQGQLTAAANVAITANAGNLSGTVLKSTVVTSSLTSVGTLGSLSVTGNISAGNVSATTFTGALSGAATTAGTVTTAAQPNITSVGTLTSLAVTGNISAGNVSATTFTGALSGAATTAGTVTTAAQGNITSVGTLTGLGVNGTITGVNITANTGVFTGNGSALTALNGSNISTGTIAQARLANSAVTLGSTALTLGSTVTTVAGLSSVTSTTFVGSLTGAATTAGTVTTAAQSNITSVGTLTSLAVTGNVTSGNVYANSGTGGFTTLRATTLTTGANTTAGTITGNWTLSAGSKLNATYADLAEKYTADAEYQPGTVLLFGGEQEVTLSTESDSFRVAGVVTTNPAYTMNNGCEGEHVATIALQGRVPVKVIGPVFKGDLLVSCGNGYAIANNIARAGTIVGKSLENFNEATGIIEVAVGRF